MRGKKERILSCIMAVLLCLTPPVMFLTQAEKEDVSVRLKAAEGEAGRPIFLETQEDQMVLPPGTDVAISGKDEKGETLPVKEIEMFAEEGERLEDDAKIQDGICHIKMPKQNAIIFVRFERPAKDQKAATEDVERGDDAAVKGEADAENETHDRDQHLLLQAKCGKIWSVENAHKDYGHFFKRTNEGLGTCEQGKSMIGDHLGFCMNSDMRYHDAKMQQVDPVAAGYETKEIMHELAVKTELILHGKVPSCPGMTDRMRFAICQAMIWRRLSPIHNRQIKEVKVDYTGKNVDPFGEPDEEEKTLAWMEKMYKKHKDHYKTSWIYCANGIDQPVCAFKAEKIQKVDGKVKKVSSDPSLTDGREAYSFEGARFGFYQNDRLMGTVTTDQKGNSTAISLYPGTYTVREEEAPKGGGYAIEKKEKTVVIRSKKPETVEFADRPRYGEIRVRKVSDDSDISVGEAYKLGGAEFSLYEDKACQKLYQKKETDQEGYAVFEKIPLGTWYVKETRAPKGFLLCETVKEITIKGHEAESAEETKILKEVEISDHPASGKIAITKTPSVPESVKDNANYSLAGACYEVRRAESDAIVGKLVTDENG